MRETRDLTALDGSIAISAPAAAGPAAVLVELDKELIVGTGADRVRFLHGIVTGDVAGTPVGGGCHATLLTVKAQIVAELRIFVRADELFLLVANGEGEKTASALSRYAIMDDFAAAVRPDYAFVALLGPDAPRTLAAAVTALSASPDDAAALTALADGPLWAHVSAGPLFVARARQLGADGFWVGGATDELARFRDVLAGANVCRLAPDVAEAARIRAGEPAAGREITEDVFPMEVGLDGAIDYRKGCFLGQEPIVRIRDRGHVNWRMVRLELAPAARDPVPGDRLESDARPKAGRITSVARLPDGRALALALVHVSIPTGAALRALAAEGPVAATVLA